MQMDTIEWTACSLEDLSPLQHRYCQGVLPRSKHPVLKVNLIGKAGNEREHHGSFAVACARIVAGLEAWQPFALILDLTELRYEWGDEMQNVLTSAQGWYEPIHALRQVFAGGRLPETFPTAVVTSANNRAGLESLVNAEPDIAVVLCDSTNQAVLALDNTLEGVPVM